MYRDGQQVIVYLGEDRRLYIDTSPGKTICEFTGRVWIREKSKNVLSITNVPVKFDGKPVTVPSGWEVQGLYAVE